MQERNNIWILLLFSIASLLFNACSPSHYKLPDAVCEESFLVAPAALSALFASLCHCMGIEYVKPLSVVQSGDCQMMQNTDE